MNHVIQHHAEHYALVLASDSFVLACSPFSVQASQMSSSTNTTPLVAPKTTRTMVLLLFDPAHAL